MRYFVMEITDLREQRLQFIDKCLDKFDIYFNQIFEEEITFLKKEDYRINSVDMFSDDFFVIKILNDKIQEWKIIAVMNYLYEIIDNLNIEEDEEEFDLNNYNKNEVLNDNYLLGIYKNADEFADENGYDIDEVDVYFEFKD